MTGKKGDDDYDDDGSSEPSQTSTAAGEVAGEKGDNNDDAGEGASGESAIRAENAINSSSSEQPKPDNKKPEKRSEVAPRNISDLGKDQPEKISAEPVKEALASPNATRALENQRQPSFSDVEESDDVPSSPSPSPSPEPR